MDEFDHEIVCFFGYHRMQPKGSDKDYVSLRQVVTLEGYEEYGENHLYLPLPHGYFTTDSTAHLWAED